MRFFLLRGRLQRPTMMCQGLEGLFSWDGPSGLASSKTSLNRPESAVKRPSDAQGRAERRLYAAFSAGDRVLAKVAKNSSAYFFATPLMRRPPSCAILPPTCATTS